MRSRLKQHIHYKITFVISLIFAVILGGIYFYLNNDLTKHTYQRIRANLFKTSAFVQTYLEKIHTKDLSIKESDALADLIGKDLDLRVTIINLDGVVLGDSEVDLLNFKLLENHLTRPEVQQALKVGIGESRRFSSTIKTDMLYVASTFGQEKIQGIIRLAIPLSEIEFISGKLQKMLLIALSFAFLFSTVFSFIASFLITRPIKEISSVAMAISGGDFSRRIGVTSHDEMGDLARLINHMSSQIKSKIDEVTVNKSRLEAVFLSMFEGVMIVDQGGSILLMNQRLKDLLCVNQDPVGKRPLEIIRNIEIQETTNQVLSCLTKEKCLASRELTVLLQDEKTLLVHATSVIREGKSDGAVLVFHDITEVRKLENIRKDFVANVSHELRTPVTNIKGYAETLLDGAIEDKEHAKDFLKIIYADAGQLAQLVDDLLDLSTIESGKVQLNCVPCNMKDIIEKVLGGLKKQLQGKNIQLNTDIAKSLPQVKADEMGIVQVLLNLIENAIKYNKEGGSITISAQEKNGFIQVDITDTGIGIPQENLPRLFERFYRVDKARSRQLGGTGLGLSIVKHIIQSHHGEVAVESELGQGTTFHFTLPKFI